jgi:selenocysteine-specific elongation factor
VPVVATAGHVDHGKSTLVRALTGIDPDRWTEEKERGLTIDLGFAWCELPTAGEVSFVDVPGHVRFISNMLAGVGAIDACLFAVAATEGWKPQSEEHLRILDVIGATRGVVALTMADVVDDDTLELATLDVADHVASTFLADAPVVPVSAPTGHGVDALATALDRVIADGAAATDRGRPRLWIDRAFTAKGAGTVVTGTLTGGTMAVDDELVVVPSGRRVRVRALQSHQHTHAALGPGRRVAVNLSGVAHADVERGDALVRPDQWVAAAAFDATLTVVPGLDHDVTRRGAYQAHIGAGHYPAQLRLLGSDALPPGATGLARVHLSTALPLVGGDRYVLRESGRGETVGGGEILDVNPVLPASRARPDRSIDRVIAERGWLTPAELEQLTGARRAPTVGRWVVADALIEDVRTRLRARLDVGPLDIASLDEREAAVLATLDGVVVDRGRAHLAGASTIEWADHPYLAALTASPFAPPEPEGVDRSELHELVARGLVVERDGCYFAATAIDDATKRVAELLRATPGGITVAAVRDALGTSRKHALPLLAHLDATGVTRRRGDLRIAGPRLPA